jgi:hypothetical protein
MAINIQLRRGTASEWTAANPTLAVAELGVETDTAKFKLGDGATAWTSLGYGGIEGVVAATSPVTYNSGTSTVGIDQTAISITTSQISDITSTAAELNILDGVTATTAELNFVDGVTSGIQSQVDSKQNELTGLTSTVAELNLLDGVTATTTELNYVDGVTSDIQTQLDARVLETNGAVTTAATGSNVVRNITLSTSAPSSGSDGDVWLVYEA